MKEPVDNDMLVIGISSRALFDLGQSHAVYESNGLQAYSEYQVEREDRFLKPGVAFPLVRKLLALNDDEVDHPGVEVILLSRNSADTGLRIFNTIEHFGLNILTGCCFLVHCFVLLIDRGRVKRVVHKCTLLQV